ncbi:MAG TPA: asparaginase [Gemmatimonas aurantiaca]|uniref:Asparaginase n=2 Tax=Gemmatimonas aurantiaca TaxID=173480 RepID=A0A3D4V958_9BACT|nr:putative L-asparaginase II [Gemmatimonas aurantiaca T-27]HCT57168.1 asparaginase [Gemmatimonas aurantiaca]
MWIPEVLTRANADSRIEPAPGGVTAAGRPLGARLRGGAALDVAVTRGDLVESTHRVHAAVVSADGALLDSARDPQLSTWWRSCAKPFQVMPLLRSGGLDALQWGVDELALACASHGGEPEHVAVAARMLEQLGLEEGDLACGPHDPLAARGGRLLRDAGQRPSRLHNNCSGKHAAMLARARQSGLATAGYERADHPVQRDCRQAVAEWTGVPEQALGVSVDGCGVSVFALPLANMALAYARLAEAAHVGDDVSRRVVTAMTEQPFLVGGTDRFDTLLMEACRGNVICKIGAEGVHTFAIVDRRIGFALKVEDGAPRAQFPAVLALLDAYDALPRTLPSPLADFLQRPVRNTRGEQVGAVTVSGVPVGQRFS